MGFDEGMIKKVYLFLKPNNIEEAIEIMMEVNEIYQHDYYEGRSSSINGRCYICKQDRQHHRNYVHSEYVQEEKPRDSTSLFDMLFIKENNKTDNEKQNICMNEHYMKDKINKNYIFINTINRVEGKCYNFSEDNSNQPITDKIEISNINQIDNINNILPRYISFWINTNNEENGFIYKKALKHCLLLSPREKEEIIISSIIFTNAHKPSLIKSSEVNNKNELSKSLPTISVPLTSSCKDKAMNYPKRTNKLYSSSNITESPLSIDDFVIRANNIKVICNKPSNEPIFISNKNEIEDDVVNTCEYDTNSHSHFLGRDKQALLSKKAVKDNHIIAEKEKEEK